MRCLNKQASVNVIKPSVICEMEEFILDIDVNGPRVSNINWNIGGQSFNYYPIDIRLNSEGSYDVEVILEKCAWINFSLKSFSMH